MQEDLPEPTCCMAWMEPYIFMEGYISQCCAVFISNNRDFIRKYSLGNVFENVYLAKSSDAEHKDSEGKSHKVKNYVINGQLKSREMADTKL